MMQVSQELTEVQVPSGTVEVKTETDAPVVTTSGSSLLDEILPEFSVQGPNVVSQTSTTETNTGEDGQVTTTHKVVRESVQSSGDDAQDQTVKTSQTVEKEVTELDDENRKRTVEITRERVVVQRKVKMFNFICLLSVPTSLYLMRGFSQRLERELKSDAGLWAALVKMFVVLSSLLAVSFSPFSLFSSPSFGLWDPAPPRLYQRAVS